MSRVERRRPDVGGAVMRDGMLHVEKVTKIYGSGRTATTALADATFRAAAAGRVRAPGSPAPVGRGPPPPAPGRHAPCQGRDRARPPAGAAPTARTRGRRCRRSSTPTAPGRRSSAPWQRVPRPAASCRCRAHRAPAPPAPGRCGQRRGPRGGRQVPADGRQRAAAQRRRTYPTPRRTPCGGSAWVEYTRTALPQHPRPC